MTTPEQTITPVADPRMQVHYWIAEGIKAHTSMNEDEANQSAEHLVDQYLDEVYSVIR